MAVKTYTFSIFISKYKNFMVILMQILYLFSKLKHFYRNKEFQNQAYSNDIFN